MDKTLLNQSFSKELDATWPCPTCGRGALSILKETFVSKEPFHSRQMWERTEDPEFIVYSFCCFLECSNLTCKEHVCCVGEGRVEEVSSGWDHATDIPETGYLTLYSPRYFDPPLRIIKLPNGSPSGVKAAVFESFRLFFLSPKSAGNSLRSAVEALLDDLKIPRFTRGKRKRLERLSLHDRIHKIQQKKYKELKEFLEAAKWIGNAGSHSGSDLTQDDVLDAYEIFEHVLAQIYEPKTRLDRRAKQINKRKGPLKKSDVARVYTR